MTYSEAILDALRHLMRERRECFCIGQGLWSPWYVGSTMRDLEKEFGTARVIDTPVSEAATTAAALGAALGGYRPVVVHPRVDFAVLAMDAMVNQAANWNHMFGGGIPVPLTIRAIINRGGEQGAQHSQALHAWFAHVPGLRVVMPATPADARDLLVASVLCDDPVLYLDDRWLYELEEEVGPVRSMDLRDVLPRVRCAGSDITLIGTGHSAHLCKQAAAVLARENISAEVIDMPVISPITPTAAAVLQDSVRHTGRLLAVDGGWATCGFAAELVTLAAEALPTSVWKAAPARLTLPATPAPTNGRLEAQYYPTAESVAARARTLLA